MKGAAYERFRATMLMSGVPYTAAVDEKIMFFTPVFTHVSMRLRYSAVISAHNKSFQLESKVSLSIYNSN